MRIILVLVFLMSATAHAQVFKCVDPATGKMTFTDKACPNQGTGDYVPIAPANGDSGSPAELAAQLQRENEALRAQLAKQEQEEKERKEKESRRPVVTRCNSTGVGFDNRVTQCITH